MKRMKWLLWATRNPVETATFIISTGLFFFACYLLSPWYSSDVTSPIAVSLSERTQEYAVGVWFLLTALPGLVASVMKGDQKVNMVKLASFLMFVDFTFLAILRLVSIGPIPATWIQLIVIALISGTNWLYLELHRE
jgi:hypothetical protein